MTFHTRSSHRSQFKEPINNGVTNLFEIKSTSWCHRKYAIIVNLSFEKSAENVNGSP
jgi:hypothetical protein